MEDMGIARPTWAEIDLDALEHNICSIRGIIKPGCKIMAMIKADAYGHGAPETAKTLVSCGVEYFGVSGIDEAIQLRRSGIDIPILITGYTPYKNIPLLLKYKAAQTIFSKDYAVMLNSAAQAEKGVITGHLKIDTGMARLGFSCQSFADINHAADEIEDIQGLGSLKIEGIFTHFAAADDKDNPFTHLQFERFNDIIKKLEDRGISFKIRHCCNSAAAVNFPDMHLDMIRPGLIVYGMYPSPYMEEKLSLRPAMSLRTMVSMIKDVEKGVGISYGHIFHTKEKTTLATLPIGYADGLLRCCSNRAFVLAAGQRVPVIGRICMDQCMVDVTGISVSEGQTVTIFGKDNEYILPVEELARVMDSIINEVVCLVGKRVPRVYFKNGKEVSHHSYLL